MAAFATGVGSLLGTHRSLLLRIAGVVIIIFGLHLTGILPIKALYADKRIHAMKTEATAIGSFLVGFAFAFGWTPCIGPILAGILAIAGVQQTVGQGVRLLAVYSLGLGVPFLIAALAINQFFSAFARIRKHYHAIEIGSGLLLCAIGILIFTDRFTLIARWLSPYLPTL